MNNLVLVVVLLIYDSLKSYDEIETLIKDCRSIVGHFKHSTSVTAQLNEIQNQLYKANQNLIQYVCARWNSTCCMFERLFKLKSSIVLYCSNNSNCTSLSNIQWNFLENLIHILSSIEAIIYESFTRKL